jgi:hypothetical protein
VPGYPVRVVQVCVRVLFVGVVDSMMSVAVFCGSVILHPLGAVCKRVRSSWHLLR